jgi:hypothetical protein
MNNPSRAFPSTKPIDAWGSDEMGMTLRDYFAAKAIERCLVKYGDSPQGIDTAAENAYRIADAMLAERDKPVDTAPPKP